MGCDLLIVNLKALKVAHVLKESDEVFSENLLLKVNILLHKLDHGSNVLKDKSLEEEVFSESY